MNIGIDARSACLYRGTGIGNYTYQLINYLNKLDKKNLYNIFIPQGASLNIPLNKNFTISHTQCGISDNFWNKVNTPYNIKYDKLTIYHIPHNGIGIPHSKNSKIIVTLHDIIPYKMPQTVSSTYLKIFNKQIKQILSMSDAIITVSNYSKNDIVNTFNYPSKKIFVTHLASESIYKPIDKQKCKLFIKKNYSINSDFILYIGGYSPRKNLSSLIKSFYLITKFYNKNIKLIIGGKKGISYPIYKNLVQKLKLEDKVIFTGFIPINHLPYFYNAASLFVFPSLYEGFGLPPLEAMACGTPVIASNKTSIPEVLMNGAYYINPMDINNMSNAIIKVLEDKSLKDKLIQNGIKRAKQLCWENTVISTIKAYNKTICNF